MQGLRRRQAPVDDREHARLHLGCHVPIANFTVIVWRDQAQNAAESLTKGSRVVVMGRLQQRAWTAEDGSARSTVEVVAEELGSSLRWATAAPVQATKSFSERR